MYWRKLKPGDKVVCIKDSYIAGYIIGDIACSTDLTRLLTIGKHYEIVCLPKEQHAGSKFVIVVNDMKFQLSYPIDFFSIPNETICRVIGIE